ncbi:MAG: diheme cytochrome c [Burkholderiales bacterium]|nr:diheme cytochrome c [Burkholderiales bacterium]OJX07852.1 MAG: cytochrome C [Burkholderiales bacterium 70-64]
MKILLRDCLSRVATIVCLSAAVGVVHAGERTAMPADVPATYLQECASCHIAYPPGALPAASWQRIMSTLDSHYGTDAELDAAPGARIGAWLQRHAGTWKHVSEAPPHDRITRSRWFERRHRKVDAAVWRHDSVKSAANCAACHAGAERGRFDDDDLRFPAGLDARYRGPWND